MTTRVIERSWHFCTMILKDGKRSFCNLQAQSDTFCARNYLWISSLITCLISFVLQQTSDTNHTWPSDEFEVETPGQGQENPKCLMLKVFSIFRAHCCVSLAPRKDMELILIAPNLQSPIFGFLLYNSLRCLIDKLGVTSFNVGILNIKLGDKDKDDISDPIFARYIFQNPFQPIFSSLQKKGPSPFLEIFQSNSRSKNSLKKSTLLTGTKSV